MVLRPQRGRFLLPFVLDGDEHTAEILSPMQKVLQTGSVRIRTGGIAIGIIARKAGFRMVHSHKVGAQLPALSPAVEQDAAVRSGRLPVKPLSVKHKFHGKAPLPEAQGRSPEGGACIAVNQGQLPFVIADQLLDIRLETQEPQGIVGGNPAAARIGGSPEAVAILLPWDMILVIDEIFHANFPEDAGR